MFDTHVQDYLRAVLDRGFAGNTYFLQQFAVQHIDAWSTARAPSLMESPELVEGSNHDSRRLEPLDDSRFKPSTGSG